MSFTITPATRQAVKPLIGLYSESGCGKTYSSLLLARGLVGPKGKIVMIDSESKRGSLYADVIPGGYDTLELGEPFSPARYIEAIRAVEASGAGVGIIDSASHEWEGIGGVIDMAAENEAKHGKGLNVWKTPKLEHSKFVLKLLQSPLPWVVCLRAKYKTRQSKDEKGKTVIVKDEHTTPIQAEDFIFEMTAHAEIFHDHKIRLTKWSHPELKKCFPVDGPITIQTGEMIARWCGSGLGAVGQATQPASDSAEREAKKKLWAITEHVHNGDRTVNGQAALQKYLIDEMFITPEETLAGMTADRIRGVILKVQAKQLSRQQMEIPT